MSFSKCCCLLFTSFSWFCCFPSLCRLFFSLKCCNFLHVFYLFVVSRTELVFVLFVILCHFFFLFFMLTSFLKSCFFGYVEFCTYVIDLFHSRCRFIKCVVFLNGIYGNLSFVNLVCLSYGIGIFLFWILEMLLIVVDVSFTVFTKY